MIDFIKFQDFIYPFRDGCLPIDQLFATLGYLIAMKVGIPGLLLKTSLLIFFLYSLQDNKQRANIVYCLSFFILFVILPQFILKCIGCVCSAIFL